MEKLRYKCKNKQTNKFVPPNRVGSCGVLGKKTQKTNKLTNLSHPTGWDPVAYWVKITKKERKK
jgi:hypothetical protein